MLQFLPIDQVSDASETKDMNLACPHCQKALRWKEADGDQRQWQLTRCPHCNGYCMLRAPAQAARGAHKPQVRTTSRRTREDIPKVAPSLAFKPLPDALPDTPTNDRKSNWIPASMGLLVFAFLLSGWFFLKQAERLQAMRDGDRITIKQAAPRRSAQ